MEMRFPWAIYVGLGVCLLGFVATIFWRAKYKGGRKVANAELVKAMPEFKSLFTKYKIYSVILIIAVIGSILACSFLIARPSEVKIVTREISNRDIYLCLDISTSMDELNLELCEELKDFIDNLHGERIGITIFNAKSVLLVPLTTDYAYLQEIIDTLHAAIEQNTDAIFYSDIDDMELYEFQFAGTLSEYGSSLIGDGLASCLYSFNDLHENPERARLIVFLTDNDLAGEPLVTVEEACTLCKANNVKVFALAPRFIVDEDVFEEAIESTDGAYFNYRDKHAMDDLLEAVESTDKSATTTTAMSVEELPQVPFAILLACAAVYIIVSWRIKV